MKQISVITDAWGRKFLKAGNYIIQINDVKVDESKIIPWDKYIQKNAKKYFKKYKIKFSKESRVFQLFVSREEMLNVEMFEKSVSRISKPLYYEIIYTK